MIVIRDYNNYIFGAYCSDFFHIQRKFYGNGETFLFTFKDTEKIQSYLSHGQDYFIYTSKNGIGIGCGDKFGLFID